MTTSPVSSQQQSSLKEKYFEAKHQGDLKKVKHYEVLLSSPLSTLTSPFPLGPKPLPSSSFPTKTFTPPLVEKPLGIKEVSSTPFSLDTTHQELLKIEKELESIEKEPSKTALEALDNLLAMLINLEESAPFQRPIHNVKGRLLFLYSLIETLELSAPSIPTGGKLILASFNQFQRSETRSSCAANVAYFATYFLPLKKTSEINQTWVEKVTKEGMTLYTALLKQRQEGFKEVLATIAEETGKQKRKELQDKLSSLQTQEKEELEKSLPLLVEEAVKEATGKFWREQGGDHLAIIEVLSSSTFASLYPSSPPPTCLLPSEATKRKSYFQTLLEGLTKQADPNLTCSLTCNGYTYGLGITTADTKTFYVIYDSHGNLALNHSKHAFCIIYEELPSAAAYLAHLVSYLDIPLSLQKAGTNQITYMAFKTQAPSTSSSPSKPAKGEVAEEEKEGKKSSTFDDKASSPLKPSTTPLPQAEEIQGGDKSSPLKPLLSWKTLTSLAEAFGLSIPEKESIESMQALKRDSFHAVYQSCREGNWTKVASYKDLLPFLTNSSEESLLTCAIEEREFDIVKHLLELHIPFSAKEGRTPLHVAARNGFVKAFPLLTPSYPLHTLSKEGLTPLHEAVLGDQREAIEFLLKGGASITTLGTYDKMTLSPPALATYLGLLDCFDAFALSDPSIFMQKNATGNLVHISILSKETGMLTHLLKHYPTYAFPLLKELDAEGRTPSALATFLGAKGCLELLKEKEKELALQSPSPSTQTAEEVLLEELVSSIKGREHKKAIQTLHFLLLTLKKPTTAILSTLYESIQTLLPYFAWTEKEKLYEMIANLITHPFSPESQAHLMADLADWHLSHRGSFPPEERATSFYLPAAHYFAQSMSLAPPLARKSFCEKASVIFHCLFEDLFPFYELFTHTQKTFNPSDYLLLEKVLSNLKHFVDAFSIPLPLQKKYLAPFHEKIRDFLLLPSSQKASNYSILLTLTTALLPHAPSSTSPIERLSISYQALSLETSKERFVSSFQETCLKDIEALNPTLTLSHDWHLEGERGQGSALPFAPLSTSLIVLDPLAHPILKDRESLLKLLFILSGSYALDYPHVTVKPPPFAMFSIAATLSSEKTSSKAPSLLPSPPEFSPSSPSFSKHSAESLLALKTLARKTYSTLRLPLWQQETIFQIETHYRNPLQQLIYALAHVYQLPLEHPQTLVEALFQKKVFTKESAELIKETLLHLHQICSRLHLHYKKYKSSATFYPYTFADVAPLTEKETEQVHACYFLVLKPLSYLLKQEKEFCSIDLIFAAVEELWWMEEQEKGLETFIPLLVTHLYQQKASATIHQTLYQKLSARLHLDPLRIPYYDTLYSLDPSVAISLINIPNRKGVRLAQRLELAKLRGALEAFTTPFPPTEETGKKVVIKGGGFTQPRYLKEELVSQLIGKEGNLIKQYEGSLHPVCRLQHEGHDLHFKQKPSQPMMEYSVYSLVKRVVGEGAPPSTLLRFEVETPTGTKVYPVLASLTIPGTNLKELLEKDPKHAFHSGQLTLLALSQLLTRPGDGRASNYIVTKDKKLFCIDNDVSFVEPIVESSFSQTVHFCSILFCLPNAVLDPTALEEFIHTDPDLLISDWLEEISLKEKEYGALFSASEKEKLYNEDQENRFTTDLLLRSGAITNLYTQYFYLERHLKKRNPLIPTNLLELCITLTGQKLTLQTLGPRLFKAYQSPTHPSPEERLKETTGRPQHVSMTTKQHLGASLGKIPQAEELAKREKFSLEKTKEEFLAYSLLRQGEAQLTKYKGKSALSIDFSSYTQYGLPDIERQSLILDGVKMLFSMKNGSKEFLPAALILTNCQVLTPEKLLPLLHKDLIYLDIKGSGLIHLPPEIETLAPRLEELYLSDSLKLQTVQRNWTFSSEALTLPHLKVLHVARCPNLQSIKIGGLLGELKANHNPRLQLVECSPEQAANITDCPNLQWKGPQVFGKLFAFGKFFWKKYFGDIGEEPPLPADIATILTAPCPIWSGKKVQETHLLILVPAQVNGKTLTLQSLGELVKSPKEGHKMQYSSFHPGGNVTASVEKNSWVLLTRDVIPGSRNKSYDAQVVLVGELAEKTKVTYEVPRLIEVAASLFMHYVRSGERLYSDSPLTYTRCQEKYRGQWPMTIGGFSSSGVYVDGDISDDGNRNDGVGAVRKL